MNRVRDYLNKSLYVLAGGSFILMTLLTCWQVFTRYILGRPSSWSEELVSYLFAWMALLGASLVVGERGHMNIPLLVEKSAPNVRMGLSILAEVIAALFAGIILVFGGIQITNLAMAQMTSALGVPVGVFYIVLPLSGILNIVYCILNIVQIMTAAEE
ncbi:MAG: TRAP transporter small permease [Lachnospiraceae bacterium]|nr:TRAP transporter small permease [Lachnospiraceae bacterium]